MTTFEEIYRKYSGDVYRFVCWLAADPHEAEDIVAETFVRVLGGNEQLRLATVKAYLLTTARNLLISRRRREGRYQKLPDEMPSEVPAPDVQSEHRDELRWAMRALQTLSELERAALLMRIQQELPYEEIARSLQISLSAAKVRVHRARIKLAQLRHEGRATA